MQGLKSVNGILRSDILRVKADFAAMSALFVVINPNMTGKPIKTMWLSSAKSLFQKDMQKKRVFNMAVM